MKQFTIAATGHTFQHNDPEKAKVIGTAPHGAFMAVLETINSMALKKSTLLADSDLSSQGRERRLKPLYEGAWSMLAAAHIRLAEFDAATAKREAALLAVPTLDPGHTACAIEDVELRGIWRALPQSERTAIMEAMGRDPEAGQRYLRLQVALMRAPYPLGAEHEAVYLASLWRQSKRLDDPAAAIAIDAEKNASQWGTRGLAHLQGILAGMTGWSRAELLAWLVLDESRIGAAKALGFGVFEIAAAKQQAAARAVTTA